MNILEAKIVKARENDELISYTRHKLSWPRYQVSLQSMWYL